MKHVYQHSLRTLRLFFLQQRNCLGSGCICLSANMECCTVFNTDWHRRLFLEFQGCQYLKNVLAVQ